MPGIDGKQRKARPPSEKGKRPFFQAELNGAVVVPAKQKCSTAPGGRPLCFHIRAASKLSFNPLFHAPGLLLALGANSEKCLNLSNIELAYWGQNLLQNVENGRSERQGLSR